MGGVAVMGEANFLFFLPSDCSRKGIMRSADRLCWKAKILSFLSFFEVASAEKRRDGKTTHCLKVQLKSLEPLCRNASK